MDVPDLAVLLTADPDTVQRRLARRGTRHRFELDAAATTRELRLYAEAAPVLERLGYRLHTVDTTHLTPEQTAQAILEAVPPQMINTKIPYGS